MRFKFHALALLALIAPIMLLTAAGASEIRYAENFEIQRFDTHQLLTVRNTARHSEQVYQYALVPRGQALPELPPDTPVIRTPVQRIVVMETVYIGYLDALDALEPIVAAATTDYISNSEIRKRVASGRVRSVQFGQALDVEQLLTIEPDLILTSISGDPAFDIPSKLRRTGLPIVLSAGYMEPHPLARAEWIQFIAAFVEAGDRAEQLFNQVEARYQELTALTASLSERPSVLCGAPYSGVWHVPGGQSYTAQAIEDAGGHYLWRDDSSQGGLPLDLESVFLKGALADFWINPSGHRTRNSLLAADARFGRFRPAQEGAVYNNTRQIAPGGGNAIWESGVVRPDDLLADLIHIFHPELLPDHDLVYYESLD